MLKLFNMRVTGFHYFRIFLVAALLSACQSAPQEPKNHSEPPPSPLNETANPHVPLSDDATAPRSQSEARGTHYAISTQGKFATQIADSIMKAGGNLADAAVAASFAISVERPQSTGIGGGGFLLFHEARTGKIYALDFRERAPLKATEKMFLDSDGKVQNLRSKDGVLATGVPGLVAGLLEFHKKFGKLSLSKIIKPSIDLATKGFPIYPQLAEAIAYRAKILKDDEAARAIFLNPDGSPKKAGDLLVQSDLAKTLGQISKHGKRGFYRGKFSKKLVTMMKFQGGLVSEEDLASYKVKWKKPLQGKFDDLDLYTMPPPSGGGTQVLEFLNIIRAEPQTDAFKAGFLSADAIHFAASALQSTFVDRAHYMGDSDFVTVPTQGLISPEYAATERAWIPAATARHPEDLKPGSPFSYESSQTTHLSLMDSKGNAISTTQTINGWLGAGVVVPGTGVVLNNEMDDFAVAEGASNLFGAIGGKANFIAAKKTPLSSMAPTIALRGKKPVLAVGAPGGTRIVSCVAETILNYFEFKLPLYESVAAVRYHHQWQPDVLTIESPGPKISELNRLKAMGYTLELKSIPCNVMAVAADGKTLDAVSDPRDIGTSVAH